MGDMMRLLNPGTIALIGASEKEGAPGTAILKNLLLSQKRIIFPVNPNRKTVLGLPCHANIAEVPESVDLTSFRMELVGERNPTPPQYFKTIEIVMHIGGKDLDPAKVDRAIALSQATYCSAYNLLRKDMEVKVRSALGDKNP
jgi:hypothetical protein